MRIVEIGWRRVDLDTGQDIVDLPPEFVAKVRTEMAAKIDALAFGTFGSSPPPSEPKCSCHIVHTCNKIC